MTGGIMPKHANWTNLVGVLQTVADATMEHGGFLQTFFTVVVVRCVPLHAYE